MSEAIWHRGDVRAILPTLPDQSFDLIACSPPFWRQRAYLPKDHPDKQYEIGQEPNPADFLAVLLDLTVQWRRLLAPHGSIAIELGDTMSGSGGAGGDYDDDGWRAGQPRWEGSAAAMKHLRVDHDPAKGPPIPSRRPLTGGKSRQDGQHRQERASAGEMPLDKSHCQIPEAYRFALAWGINPFTGERSPAGKWIIRNVVDWCRRNPTPGFDGDKFRRATSDIVIATLAGDRWWDPVATRVPADGDTHARTAAGFEERDDTYRPGMNTINSDPGGTRPLYDWWDLASDPYPGAHYAVWPPEIARRLILAMCPPRVCTTCGEPQRRVSEHDWSDCGHGTWRPGSVLDPFAGSGTTGSVATGNGRDATLIDLDEKNLGLAYDRIGGLFLREATPVYSPGDPDT